MKNIYLCWDATDSSSNCYVIQHNQKIFFIFQSMNVSNSYYFFLVMRELWSRSIFHFIVVRDFRMQKEGLGEWSHPGRMISTAVWHVAVRLEAWTAVGLQGFCFWRSVVLSDHDGASQWSPLRYIIEKTLFLQIVTMILLCKWTRSQDWVTKNTKEIQFKASNSTNLGSLPRLAT